jgi:hypothetical protein
VAVAHERQPGPVEHPQELTVIAVEPVEPNQENCTPFWSARSIRSSQRLLGPVGLQCLGYSGRGPACAVAGPFLRQEQRGVDEGRDRSLPEGRADRVAVVDLPEASAPLPGDTY